MWVSFLCCVLLTVPQARCIVLSTCDVYCVSFCGSIDHYESGSLSMPHGVDLAISVGAQDLPVSCVTSVNESASENFLQYCLPVRCWQDAQQPWTLNQPNPTLMTCMLSQFLRETKAF